MPIGQAPVANIGAAARRNPLWVAVGLLGFGFVAMGVIIAATGGESESACVQSLQSANAGECFASPLNADFGIPREACEAKVHLAGVAFARWLPSYDYGAVCQSFSEEARCETTTARFAPFWYHTPSPTNESGTGQKYTTATQSEDLWWFHAEYINTTYRPCTSTTTVADCPTTLETGFSNWHFTPAYENAPMELFYMSCDSTHATQSTAMSTAAPVAAPVAASEGGSGEGK